MMTNDYPFHIRYKCAGSVETLTGWLDDNCVGQYEFQVDPSGHCAGDFAADDVDLRFENHDDLKRFQAMAADGTVS
jgi:hypothetical protein